MTTFGDQPQPAKGALGPQSGHELYSGWMTGFEPAISRSTISYAFTPKWLEYPTGFHFTSEEDPLQDLAKPCKNSVEM